MGPSLVVFVGVSLFTRAPSASDMDRWETRLKVGAGQG